MTWDYYVHVSQKVQEQEDVRRLHELSEKIRQEEDRQKRSNLRQEKQDVLRRLRKAWQQEINRAGEIDAEEIDQVARILATQILDDATVWWFEEVADKEDARAEIYIPITKEKVINDPGRICNELTFRHDFQHLPSPLWFALEVDFELLTPWYSRDDRVFHVMNNPVRKDRAFGVPFMSASSWKGLLRWVCRMQVQEGLLEFLKSGKSFEREWRDPDWIIHLFGNKKGGEENFHQGALVFYPTWFNKIGFEVINPHSRARRAGTQPIYYEVVPPGAKGTLSLLYAPWPGMKPEANPEEVLPELLKAIEELFTAYGISAKRTAGWGTARICSWKAYHKGRDPGQATTWKDICQAVAGWLKEEAS